MQLLTQLTKFVFRTLIIVDLWNNSSTINRIADCFQEKYIGSDKALKFAIFLSGDTGPSTDLPMWYPTPWTQRLIPSSTVSNFSPGHKLKHLTQVVHDIALTTDWHREMTGMMLNRWTTVKKCPFEHGSGFCWITFLTLPVEDARILHHL